MANEENCSLKVVMTFHTGRFGVYFFKISTGGDIRKVAIIGPFTLAIQYLNI